MTAYYNEFDPKAAAWLRELIKRGLIADGVVDERDLWDVNPDDIRGFNQVHLCAGIGVWSYALRRAGWSDHRPVWTGSFPCQPFSAAGKGAGFADERHLWPAGNWLVTQCRPAVVFGEQVASKDADPWIDLVQADLEALAYSFGAVPFPSAGIGAPHIRDRLYWVADSDDEGSQRRGGVPERADQRVARPSGMVGGLANNNGIGQRSLSGGGLHDTERDLEPRGSAIGLADDKLQQRSGGAPGGDVSRGWVEEPAASAGLRRNSRPGPTNGFWGAADWLHCRDHKWRPVEPGTFPLAHGAPARVGRLRGYGNAINAEAATVFIESYLEAKAAQSGRNALLIKDMLA